MPSQPALLLADDANRLIAALDRDEIAALAEKMGHKMSEVELSAAMASMDRDGGGDVNLAEFTAWFRSTAADQWAASLLQCTQVRSAALPPTLPSPTHLWFDR